MAQKSNIEWTERTWNPIRGCSKISAGCENCYAMHVAARFSGPGQPYEYLAKRNPVNWTGELRIIEPALHEPLRRRKPTMYFVNSMSDLFHERMPPQWIDAIFTIMALTPQHTYQVLTKRSEQMRAYFSVLGEQMRTYLAEDPATRIYRLASRWLDEGENGCLGSYWNLAHELLATDTAGGPRYQNTFWALPLDNVWLGVSVEKQAAADLRIPDLLRTPAAVRFLSCEPLLGPLWLERWLDELDWVIVGGESAQGNRLRWCNVEWIRSIVEQCQAAKVPVFVKQLGSGCYTGEDEGTHYLLPLKDRKGGDPDEWPEDLRVRQFPRLAELKSTRQNFQQNFPAVANAP